MPTHNNLDKLQVLPVLPLKSAVLFPGLLMPLSAGRAASVAAIEAALKTEEKELVVIAQRDPTTEEPAAVAEKAAELGTRGVTRLIVYLAPPFTPAVLTPLAEALS